MISLKSLHDYFVNAFTFSLGGGGGSSQPTTSTVNQNTIPAYAQPYVETMLGAAQNQVYNMDPSTNTVTGFKPYTPYSTNMQDYIAPFSPLQNQSYTEAGALTTPGQFQAGSQLAGAAGMGSLGTAGQMAGAGANYNAMATNPSAVGAFMNPYMQQSLQPQLNEIARQGNIASQQAAGQATSAGAFGGTRSALAQNEAQRNALNAQQQAIGQGYNTAFQNAQQAQQFGANLGLQGLQGALSGYGQANTAASTLGNLGTNQLAAQQGILGTQNTMGQQQQTQQQNMINQAIQNYATQQQYPMQQLSNMSNLLHGLPMQSTTTQTYQAQPTALNTIAGLGTGIAGAAKLLAKKGGLPKDFEKTTKTEKFVGGGITGLNNRMAIAANYDPAQLQKEVQSGVLPQATSKALAEDYDNFQLAAQATQQPQPQPQQPSIASADSNMPTQMAGGGIVAFANRGLVTDTAHDSYAAPEFNYSPTDLDYSYLNKIGTQGLDENGNPYTEAGIAAKQRAKEESLGIKDIFKQQLEENTADKAKLESNKDRALGMSLLGASGEIFKNANTPGFGGIGAGLSKFSLDYGSALDKIDANNLALRKEGNQIQAAQMAMKQAQMSGDTAAYNAAHKEYTDSIARAGEANNENIKLKNAAGLAAEQAKYGYREKTDVANIEGGYKVKAAEAGNVGRVPMALNTMVKDRDNAIETYQKNWLATEPGKAYQAAIDYKSGIAKDKWDPVSNADHKMNEDRIKQGKAILDKIKGDVYQVHNPMIQDQWERNSQLGSNTITKDQLQGMLQPGYNSAGDVDNSNPLLK